MWYDTQPSRIITIIIMDRVISHQESVTEKPKLIWMHDECEQALAFDLDNVVRGCDLEEFVVYYEVYVFEKGFIRAADLE